MSKNTAAAVNAVAAEVKDPLDGDFGFYATKAPSELHQLHAELVTKLTGVEVTPKQVQAILGMHGKIQASQANKKRAEYKARTTESIKRGGETTAENAARILREQEEAAAAAAKAEAAAKRKPRAPRKTAAPKPAARKATPATPAKVELPPVEVIAEGDPTVIEE